LSPAYSRIPARGSLWLAVSAAVLVLGIAGFFVVRALVEVDRTEEAERAAQVSSLQVQGALERARAYVQSLRRVLEEETSPEQSRFVKLVDSTAGSVGLADALWIERVPAAERERYERRRGFPITRLTPAGRFEPAPASRVYFPASFATRARPETRQGVDVSRWPGLDRLLQRKPGVFLLTASDPASLGRDPGFYILETGLLGPRDDWFLVLFVPFGWLSAPLDLDPDDFAISVDGRRMEGSLASPAAASDDFVALDRDWSVSVALPPASSVQSALPWLMLAALAAIAATLLFVGRGIAKRRRAERELERVFALSLDLLCIAGTDGYFRQVNPAFRRTLGYSEEELLASPFVDFVHPDDRDGTLAVLEELARGADVLEFENRYLCKDGSERWLEWTATPVPREGLIYAAARDVTDRRRAEEQLRQAQKMEAVGRLAGGIAHDFNNVLTAIDGYSGFLVEALEDDEQLRADALEIRQAVARASALTRQLLTFSRRQVLQPRVVELNEIVRGAEPLLRRLIGEDVEIRTHLAAGPTAVHADPGQLEQVVINLAVNARDAMPGGGRLTIATESNGTENVALTVSDTGEGMDSTTRRHIFEPFFTTKEHGKGTGLGLATVYGIVEQSGGTIDVTSDPGEGSTFRVVLPAAAASLIESRS
jgi:PAS domain S-box-containing protein